MGDRNTNMIYELPIDSKVKVQKAAQKAHPSAIAHAESRAKSKELQQEIIAKKKKEMKDLVNNPRSYLLKGESWVGNEEKEGMFDGTVKSTISEKIDKEFPKFKPYLDEAGLSSAENIAKFKSVINGIIFEHYTKPAEMKTLRKLTQKEN